ncbi:MAG: ABC transporter permease DevC [Isosphaeraceae bacterium]|nr:ABC transporter permease DevC [Isosphaeraceae bacterium]
MFPSAYLAWCQLSHGRIKLIVASAGVVVAVLLMLMQLGFLRAAYDSTLIVPRRVSADLIIMSSKTPSMFRPTSWSRRLLYRLPAHPAVASVQAVYLGNAKWRNPWNREEFSIFVYGLEPFRPLLDFEGLPERRELMKLPDTVLFDAGSRANFGPVSKELEGGRVLPVEVNRRRVEVVGLTRAGVTIGVDGNLVTSDTNFLRLFPERHVGRIDLGLVELKPGVSAGEVAVELAAMLGPEARVLTRSRFQDHELKFLRENGPIEFIFMMGTAVGFFIGFVIVYQILHTDVTNHLPQFATMKAIGFADGYLLRLVLSEGLLLAVFGFFPGLGLATILYEVAGRVTLLPVEMTLDRVVLVFSLTIVMCLFSGAIAVRKLRAADPADVF